MTETEEKLKSLLKRVKEESEKASLKLNIQKTKVMASSPTTSWQMNGETMETVTGFIFLGSKITADGDWSSDVCSSDLATVRTGHGTTDWFQIGKGVRQGCILSPCLFNLYAE